MKKILYLGKTYFKKSERDKFIEEVIPYKKTGFFTRNFFLKPIFKLRLGYFYFKYLDKTLSSQIRFNDYDYIIVSEDSYIKNIDIAILKKISNDFKNATIIFWFRNTYTDKQMLKKIRQVKKYTENIYTFDNEQAIKYNISYNTQNLPTEILETITDKKVEYDFSLVAAIKDRGEIYSEIVSILLSGNWNIKIYLTVPRFRTKVYKKKFPILAPFIFSKSISKSEYNQILASSKVIIDYYKENQVGETFRVLESTMLGKKIITNNLNLKNLSFYNEKNFLFSEELNNLALNKFLLTPYDLETDCLKSYEIEQWLERFEIKL